LLFGLAVKYLNVFPPEEMKEIERGKRSELPAHAAFNQPLWSATTLAFVMGAIFMFSAVALSYDGIKIRSNEQPHKPIEIGDVNITKGLEKIQIPDKIAMKMGPLSPGQVTFDHKQHLDSRKPDCAVCHSGQFRMLKTSVDIPPDKKMLNCGDCHNGMKAVAITDKLRCNVCHVPK
jgi:c(7)-type cytochrome triheme protein